MICAPKIFGCSNAVRMGGKHRQGFGGEISGKETNHLENLGLDKKIY